MAEVLDGEYETVEEAALAALEAAYEIIKARAKFTVVGQIKTAKGEEPGEKISLGWYATANQATQDAIKLAYSAQTHEEALAWVLPIFNGTPNAWYVKRKKDKKDAEAIGYRQQELARRVKWFEDHPDEPIPDDWTVVVAFDNETDECEPCKGLGRIPKPEIARRADRRGET